MQLGFAHRSLKAEQQPVVEQSRVINAVGVANQCVSDAGEIDEMLFLAFVAGHPVGLAVDRDCNLRHMPALPV